VEKKRIKGRGRGRRGHSVMMAGLWRDYGGSCNRTDLPAHFEQKAL